MDVAGIDRRRVLLTFMESHQSVLRGGRAVAEYIYGRDRSFQLLLNTSMQHTCRMNGEPAGIRQAYGSHICGRSVLLARRMLEAGVPLVTVYCGAGDLNGSRGSHWDTHIANFTRLRHDMLPPLDQASAALIRDLHLRGMLEDTLVVWLTEFARPPKINSGGGRDHYPFCYSVALAGGGIAGGRSDDNGGPPAVQNTSMRRSFTPWVFHQLSNYRISQDV